MTFSTNRLELAPSGFDRMTYEEIAELLEGAARTQAAVSGAGLADVTGGTRTTGAQLAALCAEVSFAAVLPDFKLIAHNGGTEIIEKNDFLGEQSESSVDTFSGEIPDWKFGLIQREGDLLVHLRSKPGYGSEGELEDERSFDAFLNALAFIHGQHGWPFSVEHRRDGKLVHDRVQLHKAVARTPHAPFSERLAFNAFAGKVSWDFQASLQTVYAFFRSGSDLSHEIAQLLYLCREAGRPGVPHRITSLGLCTLLESLVQVIYAERLKPQKSAEMAAFEAAKQQVCNDLKQRMSERSDPAGFERMLAIVGAAGFENTRVKFDAVIEHLGLRREDDWRRLFALWTSQRNPLSHRLAADDSSEASMKQAMAAESDIAGAINCIVLKLMGYSGFVRRSAFEEKYVVI